MLIFCPPFRILGFSLRPCYWYCDTEQSLWTLKINRTSFSMLILKITLLSFFLHFHSFSLFLLIFRIFPFQQIYLMNKQGECPKGDISSVCKLACREMFVNSTQNVGCGWNPTHNFMQLDFTAPLLFHMKKGSRYFFARILQIKNNCFRWMGSFVIENRTIFIFCIYLFKKITFFIGNRKCGWKKETIKNIAQKINYIQIW